MSLVRELRCVKDFIMEDGEVAFKSGNRYNFQDDGECTYITYADETDAKLFMDLPDLLCYFEDAYNGEKV